MQFHTPLGAAAWAILAAIPAGILALYFLKLRRRPVRVPSTLLWRRSLEDLHVNSLFQRLRRNLLLFLQLLAVGLAMLALAGPRVRGTTDEGRRYILAIDNSASMSATDVAPSRLQEALRQAELVIDGLQPSELAMILSFSDRAEVVSSYTGNRAQLRARLRTIRPTQATTSLREALEVAAGLANPSSDFAARALPQGVVAVTAMIPPKLLIYTDGGFPDVEGFRVGNLEPEVIVIGPPPAPVTADRDATKAAETATVSDPAAGDPSNNLAILALQSARNEEAPDQVQVFGRVRNYRDEHVATTARLFRHDLDGSSEPRLIDAVALELDPQGEQSFQFELPDAGRAALEVRLDVDDALPLDDRAYSVFGAPRRARVLLVTPGNRYLEETLRTPAAAELADLTVLTPEQAAEAGPTRDLRSGAYDLAIFDRARPADPPEANTLYFGALPPGEAFEGSREVEWPVILDWDLAHPLLNYIRDLGLVRIARARTLELPPGATALMEAQDGPIAFAVPRGGFVDAVVTFPLIDGKAFNTDWMVHRSFPIFLFNALAALGNARDAGSEAVHRTGQPVILRADPLTKTLRVTAPDGSTRTLERTPQGTFVYNDAHSIGLYRARWEDEGRQDFAVNLLDARESNLATRGMVPEGVRGAEAERYRIKIGYTQVEGTRRAVPVIQDWWKPVAIVLLGVLLLEWYIYNRRVFI